jgi:hypothetical protein
MMDTFEKEMEYRIANLEKAIDDGNYSTEDHSQGQLGGLKYALSVYRRDCKEDGNNDTETR